MILIISIWNWKKPTLINLQKRPTNHHQETQYSRETAKHHCISRGISFKSSAIGNCCLGAFEILESKDLTPGMYLSDIYDVFFMKWSFDGLLPRGRQDKWLLHFQQKTGSRAVPEGNALKRPLLPQLQALCWEFPGRQQLLERRRKLTEFGFMLLVTPV